jgi:hypothetical protein
MTCDPLLLLGILAELIISDLGTHIFMGPLWLLLEVLIFFFCALYLKLSEFYSLNTLGLTTFGFGSHEATTVFFL